MIKIIIIKGNMSLLRNAAWCLSNCIRGKPIPDLELVKEAIPILCDMLINVSDDEVKTDVLWALSYLT